MIWLRHKAFKTNLHQSEALSTDHTILSLDGEVQPVYIFVHSPKTGGSTIRHVLKQWCIAMDKFCLEITGNFTEQQVMKIRRIKAFQRNSIDTIMGHIPFNIHNSLQLKRPVKYLTIIRDPIRQMISAFHYKRLKGHYLGGAYVLKSAIRQLQMKFDLQGTLFNDTVGMIELDERRNAVINLLTTADPTFLEATECFSHFGGSAGWSGAHNSSVQSLQSMNTTSLLMFANEVVNTAWKSSCTATLHPLLTASFGQFLRENSAMNSTLYEPRPQWVFGNNPLITIFCCYHLWFESHHKNIDIDQNEKCPNIRNEKTLNCALANIKQLDLVLVSERMDLSLKLLEKFLNWTMPMHLKHIRLNEGVSVSPTPPDITPEESILAEKLTSLDRIFYQTALLKFWSTVHSSNLL